MRWTWDPKKARANRADHGLSFETAARVFDAPFHASKPDPHPDGDRWHTIGLVGTVLLLVVHTWPEIEVASEGDEPVGRIISARKATPHERKAMKKQPSRPLTRKQLAELKSLAKLPDDAIDTSDAPELPDWSGAKRGLFYRPVKQQLTLRLDADVIAWFREHAGPDEGYQTRINRVLRSYVEGQAQRSRRRA